MKYKVIGLVCIGGFITIIECYALSQGINGTVLAASVGALASMFGWFVGKKSESLEK